MSAWRLGDFPDWGSADLLTWLSEEPFAVRAESSGTWPLTGVHPAWSPRSDWIVSVFVADVDPSTRRLNFVKADGSIHLNGDRRVSEGLLILGRRGAGLMGPIE